jgi:integrase/recombinase XerD
MKFVVIDQVVLSRPTEGPLAAYLVSFAESLRAQGYCLYWQKRQVRIAACFSRWLKQTHVEARSICADHVVRYFRYRARHVQILSGDTTAITHFIDLLRHQGVIPPEKKSVPRLTSAERYSQAYELYLRDTRALAKATIHNYVPFVRTFLNDRFGARRATLSRLCADDVVKFVQRQVPRLHLKQAKLMTTALRSFLRFARYRGDVTLDLAAAVPTVANWSMTSIPRAIPADQVEQVLASIDRSTAVGRRDYAILLLLARLGLRSSEVVFLELDDIDWNAGHFSVRGKNGQRSDLPLSTECGKAIAAYLRHGRPKSNCRQVFLRSKAPIDGLQGPSSLGAIVRHSLERADIKAPTYGAHQFRHGLATDMLGQGASLGEIGDVLGHCHPQTTMIYAKVDIKALRTLALPWPGSVK